MTHNPAATPFQLGATTLPNRLVMAPMTRSRATEGELATPDTARYYRQRAGAGLIVSEAIHPGPQGRTYVDLPALHTAEQVESWRAVTAAVHAEGGRVHAQLMHGGRIGPAELRGGRPPLGPSAVAAPGTALTRRGWVPNEAPDAMTEEQVLAAVADHATAARNAIAAGFDGVQVHGANGYLVQQFLCADANTRTDRWGGPARNRVRFAVEVARAVADVVGPERTSLRISPGSTLKGIREAGTDELYAELLDRLDGVLGFLDVVEGRTTRPLVRRLRDRWRGTFLLNPFQDDGAVAPHDAVRDALDLGADLVGLGRPWLANPDLPDRIARGGPYNRPDPTTYFGGGPLGYLDYPRLDGVA
ncbi:MULTISPECIES: alkene reductase [Actinosynnema]|uniref:oxidoreductase n=1 Tax=Actinosynnema TaxID=40566 RepID=UPI0020A4A418|nr:alkene reductase [Actinosynnema pretiosum]MCP2092107.1 N-ethylmaleimide reductase [Actinosynnema pretiosum]